MTANSKLAAICGKFPSWYATPYKNIRVCELECILAGERVLFCSCQHYYMAKSESLVFSGICFRWLVVRGDVVSGGGRRRWDVVQVFCRSRPFWCGALYVPLSLPAHSIHYMQSRGTQLFFFFFLNKAICSFWGNSKEETTRKSFPSFFFFSLHPIIFSFRQEKHKMYVGALKIFVIFAGIIIWLF